MRRYEFADNFAMTRGHHTMKMGGGGLIRGNHSESHTFFPGRFVFGNLTGALLSPCLAAPATACGLTGVSAAALDSLQTVSLARLNFTSRALTIPFTSRTGRLVRLLAGLLGHPAKFHFELRPAVRTGCAIR